MSMRDLLDKLDSLDESRGLSARSPGEEFRRTGGSGTGDDLIVFQGLDFYPNAGSYDSTEEMLQAYDQISKKLNPTPEMVNQPTGRARAFGIAKFKTAVGDRYLVKFAQDIKQNRTANTFWQTADIPGGFTYATARAEKEKVGYKPSQVLTNFKSQTPGTILEQIKTKFGASSSEYQAAVIISQATTLPISVPSGNMDFAGFRDYFCEMMQPIALINGLPVTGNAAQAAKLFLGGDYSKCMVSFDDKPGGKLFDSLMIAPNGKQIKLSSKGAKGAMASSVNLIRSVEELEEAGLTQFREQYPEVIEILEIIDRGDHYTGPLNLGVLIGLISQQEANTVIPLLKPLPAAANIDNVSGLSDSLKKIYKDRTADDPAKVVPLNHMVASIAYKVCNNINLTTNFTEAAADILNNSAFVQMYTEAKKGQGEFIIQTFKTIWPSKLFTEVTLEAQKSYSSTSSSAGKLVFNINKEPKIVQNVDSTAGGVPGTDKDIADYIPGVGNAADLDTVSQKRSGIKASTGKVEPTGTSQSLGRSRR